MKKFYLSLVVTLLLCTPAFAKMIEVEALNNFSTANPPKTISVKVVYDIIEESQVVIPKGTIVHGKIVNVKDPKRLKRDASFSFEPISYTDPEGNVNVVKRSFKGKYTTPIDKKKLAKKAALGVGNYFVKGLSMGVSTIEGVVKNEEDNRLKSGAKALYNSSPVSYIEEGKDIEIKTGEIFYLNFTAPNEEDSPNYEFTQLDENKSNNGK